MDDWYSVGPEVYLIGILLFVIVLGVLIAVRIYDSRINRAESKEHSDMRCITKPSASTTSATPKRSISTSDRGTTTYTRNNTEKQYTPKTSQKTIYEFKGKQSMRLCPICDGENELEAKVCEICKRNISIERGTRLCSVNGVEVI